MKRVNRLIKKNIHREWTAENILKVCGKKSFETTPSLVNNDKTTQVDGKPVGEWLAHTHRRTTRKHNASGLIHGWAKEA